MFKSLKKKKNLESRIWLLELEVRTLQERLDDLQHQLDLLQTPKNTRSCWPLPWHKKS